jgi:flagellum-specific ATP synthase
MQIASQIREIIASYQDAEDLITIGAYKPGQNARVDRAVQKIEAVNQFLRQSSDEPSALRDTWQMMSNIVNS